MKGILGKILSNTVTKTVLLTAFKDLVFLYAQAFVNVVTDKTNQVCDEEEISES